MSLMVSLLYKERLNFKLPPHCTGMLDECNKDLFLFLLTKRRDLGLVACKIYLGKGIFIKGKNLARNGYFLFPVALQNLAWLINKNKMKLDFFVFFSKPNIGDDDTIEY